MVRQLETEGRLMEALWEAQETTLDEMETLTRKLEREQQLTPEHAQTTAWEFGAGEVYSPAAREPERLNDRVRVDGLSRRPCSAAEDSIRRSKRSGLVQRAVQGVGGADEE
jgi:hypothetical protein